MNLVSVILPTYNVENYIYNCIKSIVNQTYKNLEIIIIIDGSTDNSYNIAREWKKKDNRIKIYYQENAGAGPARNKGLKYANGEFILFVDPDDWIDRNMIEILLNYQQEYDVDMVTSGYIKEVYYKNEIIKKRESFEKKLLNDKEDVRKKYIELYILGAVNAPTRILYRKSIIDKYNIIFPDLRRSQDVVFNYRYYNHINSIYIIPEALYHYRMDDKVYINKLKDDYYKTLIYIYNEQMEMFNNWKVEILDEDYYKLKEKFLIAIGYCIESCVLRNSNFDMIVTDLQVNKIIKDVNPKKLYYKLLKLFIINKHFLLIKFQIRIKNFVRNKCRLLFKKLKN